LETDERCPMCDAKQHVGKRKRRRGASHLENNEIPAKKKEVTAEVVENSAVENEEGLLLLENEKNLLQLEYEKRRLLQLVNIYEENEIRVEKDERIARFVDGVIISFAIPFMLLAFMLLFTTADPGSHHTFESSSEVFFVILTLGAIPVMCVIFRKKNRKEKRSDSKLREELQLEAVAIFESEITEEFVEILHDRRELRVAKMERVAKFVDGMIICLAIAIILFAFTIIFLITDPESYYYTFWSSFPMFLVVLTLGVVPILCVVFRMKNRKVERERGSERRSQV